MVCMITVCAMGVADELAECVNRVPLRRSSANTGSSVPAANMCNHFAFGARSSTLKKAGPRSPVQMSAVKTARSMRAMSSSESLPSAGSATYERSGAMVRQSAPYCRSAVSEQNNDSVRRTAAS